VSNARISMSTGEHPLLTPLHRLHPVANFQLLIPDSIVPRITHLLDLKVRILLPLFHHCCITRVLLHHLGLFPR
jgi:hypothetical protein